MHDFIDDDRLLTLLDTKGDRVCVDEMIDWPESNHSLKVNIYKWAFIKRLYHYILYSWKWLIM